MAPHFYIASKLYKNSGKGVKDIKKIINISVSSTSVSILIMVLSICIVKGFQKEIKDKLIQFDAHIRLGKFGYDKGTIQNPVMYDSLLVQELSSAGEIKAVQPFIEKGGIVKTKEEVHGVFLKGLSLDYDTHFFRKNLIRGERLTFLPEKKANEIIISEKLSRILHLDLGDKLKTYFVQKPIRARAFTIVGIYSSGMEQFDASYIFCDLRQLQSLNKWAPSQVEGYEIYLNNIDKIDEKEMAILRVSDYKLSSLKITDKYAEVFGWLNLLDMNVVVILFFAIVVSIVNIIAVLLIMIIDKINFIATLKVLGMQNKGLIRIFSWLSLRIILKGLFIGNILAFSLAFLQQKFGFISLPEESYYIEKVPIFFSWEMIIGINILAILCSFLCIIIPSLLITRISPSRAIKFS